MTDVATTTAFLSSPLLIVDGRGVVLDCGRTKHPSIGKNRDEVVGRQLCELFADADAVRALRKRDWAGVEERHFDTLAARTVSLSVVPRADEGWSITLHDVTTTRILDDAYSQRRRVVAISEMADALSRELADPMSVVQGRLELLLEFGLADRPDTVEANLRTALEHARRVSTTLRNLRLFGRTPASRIERVLLADALEEAVEIAGPRLASVAMRIHLEPDDLAAGAESALLGRVLGNLLVHLVDASRTGYRLVVQGVARPDETVVTLYVGPRDPPASETPAGEVITSGFSGGLGLCIAATLAGSMGGLLTRCTVPDGVMVMLRLPAPPRPRQRRRQIKDRLLVVGSPSLVSAFDELIAADGFEVIGARDAPGALELLQLDPGVSALATDLLLDGMSGLALVGEASRRWPRLAGRMLILTRAQLAPSFVNAAVLRMPLRRRAVLRAFGRRVRRRR